MAHLYSTAITRNAYAASKVLKAIANPNRLMILCQLQILGERTVNQLHANLSLTQPALSQHLALMRKENIITSRKSGTAVYYSIADELVASVLNALDEKFSHSEENSN